MMLPMKSKSRVKNSPDSINRRRHPYPQRLGVIPQVSKKQIRTTIPSVRTHNPIFTLRNLALAAGFCVFVIVMSSNEGFHRRLVISAETKDKLTEAERLLCQLERGVGYKTALEEKIDELKPLITPLMAEGKDKAFTKRFAKFFTNFRSLQDFSTANFAKRLDATKDASGLEATDPIMTPFFKQLNIILETFKPMITFFLSNNLITKRTVRTMDRLFTELDELPANREWRLASRAYRGVYHSILAASGTTMKKRKISPELLECLEEIIQVKYIMYR